MPSLAEICLRMCEPCGASVRPRGVHSCLPEAEAASTGGEVVHPHIPDAEACASSAGGQMACSCKGKSKRRGRQHRPVPLVDRAWRRAYRARWIGGRRFSWRFRRTRICWRKRRRPPASIRRAGRRQRRLALALRCVLRLRCPREGVGCIVLAGSYKMAAVVDGAVGQLVLHGDGDAFDGSSLLGHPG